MTTGRTIAIIAALVYAALLVMHDFNWQYATVVFIIFAAVCVIGIVFPYAGGS